MQTLRRLCLTLILLASVSLAAQTPSPMTWDEVRHRFEQDNPTLLAGQLNIDESQAQEITADLRPNPQFTLSSDGTQIAPHDGVWQPFSGTLFVSTVSYLHEREHKRELRLESAQKGTAIAVSTQAELERSLLFGLRSAFVSALQAKAVLQLAKDNLAYYDHVLDISRTRFKAGDIAEIDLDRLELQRVQYESDLETAGVNLRTAKITLLTLLNDRTPVDKYDVTGPYDFAELPISQEEFRKIALENRPDLRAAVESIDKAQTDHKLADANGSADPTFSLWVTPYNASFNNTNERQSLGGSVTIPLRVFDRNQGEKLRTQLDITRDKHLHDAAEAQVFSDVDSGYTTLGSTVKLLEPYKTKYLQQSVRVRDTVWFSYQHGGAALLEFLNAESEYRAVQLNYVNLVGSYLTAAAQLNMAVGREVIQ
jgi:cobalt-zinc-cadmium efflux system outer membrane protein